MHHVSLILPSQSRLMRPQEIGDDLCWTWDDFFDHRPGPANPFLSAAWGALVGQVNPDARVAVLYDEDGVVGFFPFQFICHALSQAERIGGALADGCGVVGSGSLRLDPAALLASVGLHYLAFDHLLDEQARYGLPTGQLQVGLRLPIGEDYYERLAQANGSFVKKLRRRERQLAREIGPLRFTWHDASSQAVHNLIDRKREQYARTGAGDALDRSWKRALVRGAASSQAPRCTGVLSTLYAGDQWVASALNLRCGDVLHAWLPVYEPAMYRYGPGHLLRRHVIEQAVRKGIAWIDLGEGENSHKLEYLPQRYSMSRGNWSTGSWRAVAGELLAALRWRGNAAYRAGIAYARRFSFPMADRAAHVQGAESRHA